MEKWEEEGEEGKEEGEAEIEGQGQRDCSHVGSFIPRFSKCLLKTPKRVLIIYQLTGSVQHYFYPAITSKWRMPTSMGSEPLSRARPEINLNNLISTFRRSVLTHCAKGKTEVKQERLTRSVPAVRGEVIVCLHLRRKGHYLAAWGALESLELMIILRIELGGELPIDRPWLLSLTGANGRGQDTAAWTGIPLSFAGYWFTLWDVSFLAVLIFRVHICLFLSTEKESVRGAWGKRNGLCLPVCRGSVCGDVGFSNYSACQGTRSGRIALPLI